MLLSENAQRAHFVSVAVRAWWITLATLAAGAALVGWLLCAFARGKRR
jgi:hypothetical protein